MIVYNTVEDIVRICRKNNMLFWQVVMRADAQERMVSEDISFAAMREMYRAMKRADSEYDKNLKSPSGLSGGDGEKMRIFNSTGNNLCGALMGLAMEKAIKMGESNACMKRIVAAPTAGACGVIPAVFLSYETCFNAPEDKMVEAMFITAGIGAVIAKNASIAGASGGCQAEIGTACAMAAAGLAYLNGMSIEETEYSAEVALEHHLGLTCDPVCGLVQIPCIERNAVAAMRAINAVSLASFLTDSRKISLDTVISAMYETGRDLAEGYRETATGGLAKLYKR